MTEEKQVVNLFFLIGPNGVRIYNQFTFDEDQEDIKTTLADVLRFDAHFEPVKNVVYDQGKFNDMRQSNPIYHRGLNTG